MSNTKTINNEILRAILTFNTGRHKDKSLKLKLAATIFGREKGDIILNEDSEVSATHCQIQYIEGSYFLFDMNSSNGTFVNGAKILKQELKAGDEVKLGGIYFTFNLVPERKARTIPTLFESSNIMLSREEKTSVVGNFMAAEQNKNPWSIELEVSYPDGTEEKHTLTKNKIYIGRESTFGKFDHDPQISRKHIKITCNDEGKIFVEDQGSTNGSLINNNKIKGIQLVQKTDLLTVGSCKIKIRASQD